MGVNVSGRLTKACDELLAITGPGHTRFSTLHIQTHVCSRKTSRCCHLRLRMPGSIAKSISVWNGGESFVFLSSDVVSFICCGKWEGTDVVSYLLVNDDVDLSLVFGGMCKTYLECR